MLIASFFLFLLCTVPALAQDWPQWRGPQRDGRGNAAIALPTSWPEQLQLQWEIVVGTGHASPLVVGDKVYIHARKDEREIVTCLNLTTGRTLGPTTTLPPTLWTQPPTATAKAPNLLP